MHPEEPTILDFQLATDSIPLGFLHHDIIVDDCWHVILATDKMILLLSGSKNWYADGTFDVVWKPFTQLFSIHAFVRSDSCIKQVPLMFVIMSGKRKMDYKKVLKAIKSLLPSCALDFEAAMWQAASDVFPNVKLLGCVFH